MPCPRVKLMIAFPEYLLTPASVQNQIFPELSSSMSVTTSLISPCDLFIDTNVDGDPKEIDWILYKGSVIPKNYEEINYNINGKYPSDHKPIFVEFQIND